jgi:16S rRNA (cytidine1402-2'-O)-methyltransferase
MSTVLVIFTKRMYMPVLYMMGTPIGNLGDLTFRAVEVLKEADVLACEDTRETAKILAHCGISGKRLISCRSANERNSSAGIVKLMQEGNTIVYVSDAGSPGVSDPGRILVREVRDAGFDVIPVPGVSAVTALVSVCGFPGKGFFFEGFLSPKKGKREKRLLELLEGDDPFILYESPYRIEALLSEFSRLDPERNLLLGREMTKKFEEYLEGKPENVLALLRNGNKIRGEMALLVAGKKKSKFYGSDDDN